MEATQKNQTTEPAMDDLLDRPGESRTRLELPRLVLASASPRRAEILRIVDWPFEVLPVDIDESRLAGEDAESYVKRLAREKASAASLKTAGRIIVAADTTVTIDDHILEKPADEEDARRML